VRVFSPLRIRGRRESRVRAAPAVSCAKLCIKNAHEHTGSAETLRPSLRNGLTAYAVLSPATNSSCHRRQRIDSLAEPGRARKTSADLASATDARTTRFCRTLKRRSSCPPHIAHEVHLALRLQLRAQRSRVHRIQPRVRDDRDTPLCGVDGKNIEVIWVKPE
jgi:hypothetical protein